MSAWLFAILRNLFRTEYRKRRREVEDADGSYAESLKSHPNQHSRVELQMRPGVPFPRFATACAHERYGHAGSLFVQ
jgi:DNA-directed RNA polymerase specialized sigma24 family protein